jgi:hypothetical protein
MERCNRCNMESPTLMTLSRYVELVKAQTVTVGPGMSTELVCVGCATPAERGIAQRIGDDPDLLAFVLAMADTIFSLAAALPVPSTLFPSSL